MNNDVAAKDITDLAFLEALLSTSGPSGRMGYWVNRTTLGKKLAFPEKVILAKARRLMKRGYIDGCDCGCRGDFTLLEKGREYMLDEYFRPVRLSSMSVITVEDERKAINFLANTMFPIIKKTEAVVLIKVKNEKKTWKQLFVSWIKGEKNA
jgi:hypothetical protein